MSLDTNIVHFLNGFASHSTLIDGLIVFIASYLPYLIIIAFAEWLYFFSASWREKKYIFGVTIISALVSRFGITEIIRFFYHRPRPFITYADIHNLIPETSWSFPSGHATFFFALVTAVYLYDKKWGSWLFIATIIMTLGRIAAGVHYPSDIFGGMLIGMSVAYTTYFFGEKWRTKKLASGE